MTTLDIDLRQEYGPARDQGLRQTCLAFAASDAHALVHSRPAAELSAEYAHYHASHRMPHFDPAAGTTPAAMFDALEVDGQPVESQWPYLSSLPTDLSTYVPPVTARLFRHRGELVQNLNAAETLLQLKSPLIAGLTLTASFYGIRTDDPMEFDPDLNPIARHAVLIIGFLKRAKDNAFLIRNSWGKRWGASGHALLSTSYIEPRLLFLGAYRA